ncbi:MAG: glycosyltransferase family 2 protein [Sporomusaceae bacterium]|nr:glycosyltransferase family 2 protein [Sporomusaceae bacterium]
MARTLVVIPAFNERNNVVQVIRDVQTSLPEVDILVVNDCSSDATSAAARSVAGVKVVDLPCNLGIGGAVQTGFKYARDAGYDYLVQIDGDGQHIAGEVRKLAATMRQNGCDMVIGSRFLEVRSFRTTWARRCGIKFFEYLFQLLIRARVSDSTSGFRLYNRRCIELLSCFYSNDYPEPDAIILLHKYGLRLCEVGVAMRPRQQGESSITLLKSPYYMAKVLLTIFCSCTRRGRAG